MIILTNAGAISTSAELCGVCYSSMSHDQNLFHAMLGKNYSNTFVSKSNGPITFGLDMLHYGNGLTKLD